MKNFIKEFFEEFGDFIFLFFAFVIIFISLQFRVIIVDGNSMNPTLKNGDIGIVHITQDIKDKDIIMLDTADAGIGADIIIKRYVDNLSTTSEVYVLGDNTENSKDSADFGRLSRSSVIGNLIVYYSFAEHRFVFL